MSTKTSILLAIAGLGLLAAAGSRHETLMRFRSERHMVPESEMADAPPLVTFSMVVLGGFRGILSDALWLRATHLQDEGQYVELVQLSDWITKLEPRSTDIWQFHAWNMAYNVSVMMADPEDRWRWVWNGVLLLRDQGLRYNPGDPGIYSHLAWIFHHKMGGDSDETSPFYRRRWLKLMEPLVQSQASQPAAFFLLDDETTARRLIDEFKLTPEQLRDIEVRYGPLDWRLPETHAIYWAHAGLAAPDISRQKAMCRRIVYQGMSTEFFQGRLVYDPDSDTYVRLARLDLLDKVIAAYAEADRESPDGSAREPAVLLITDAVRTLMAFGQVEQAEQLYVRLRKTRPDLATMEHAADLVAAEPQIITRHANGCEPLVLIEGTLRRANAARHAGDTAQANALDEQAVEAWHRFADRLPDPVRRRMDVPPFEAFRKAVMATEAPR